MITNQHILQKFELNLEMGQNEKLQATRSAVLQKLENEISMELEDVMNELCPTNELIQLDSLKIDVGNVSIDNLVEEVKKAIRTALKEQIYRLRDQRKFRQSLNVDPKGGEVYDESSFGELEDAEIKQFGHVKSPTDRQVDGLVDFMNSGVISWWNPLRSPSEMYQVLDAALVKDIFSAKSLQIFRDKLIATISQNEQARNRFVFTFDQQIILLFIEKSYPLSKQEIAKRSTKLESILTLLGQKNLKSEPQIKLILLAHLKLLSENKTKSLSLLECLISITKLQINHSRFILLDSALKTRIQNLILAYLHIQFDKKKPFESAKTKAETKRTSSSKINLNKEKKLILELITLSSERQVEQVINHLSSWVYGFSLLRMKTLIENNINSSSQNLAVIIEKFQAVTKNEKKAKVEKSNLNDNKKDDEQAEITKNKISKKEKNQEFEEDTKESIQTEMAYFNFAGIVILWPFLSVLFDDRKLIAESKFVDEFAQIKALQMLNYLANGDESLDEIDMPLNKVLCGIPRNQSILFTTKLSKDDKAELNELLLHVIKSWSILGNTSVNGLRQTFFHRKGQIAESIDDWQVKVESRSVDILLDKIPWGIRMIKLPWMNKIMYVEW